MSYLDPIEFIEKYDLWKLKMISYLEAINMDSLDIIQNGIHSLINDKGNMVSQSALNEEKRYQCNIPTGYYKFNKIKQNNTSASFM